MSTERNNLNELEAKLASLAPSASRTDRDRTMYLAGFAAAEAQVSASRTGREPRNVRGWLWPLSTAAMALLALSLGALLALERQSQPLTAQTPPGGAKPASPQESPEQNEGRRASPKDKHDLDAPVVADRDIPKSWPLATYVQLRDQVLRDGIGALARSPAHTDVAPHDAWTPHSRQRIHELLEG